MGDMPWWSQRRGLPLRERNACAEKQRVSEGVQSMIPSLLAWHKGSSAAFWFCIAISRGVAPSLSRALTSAPRSTNSRAIDPPPSLGERCVCQGLVGFLERERGGGCLFLVVSVWSGVRPQGAWE
jgi:hypothetical protein